MLLKAFHVLTNYTKLGLDTKFDLKAEHLHLCIIVQGLITHPVHTGFMWKYCPLFCLK